MKETLGASRTRIRPLVAFLILLLVPVNSWWVVASTLRAGSSPVQVSLYYNAIATMLLFLGISRLVARVLPRGQEARRGAFGLNRGELLALYTSVSVGSGLAGVDRMFVLVPLLGHADWFASAENDWASLFHRYIPDWLTVRNRNVLEGYYEGSSTLYTTAHLRAWLPVVLWWTAFIVALHVVMLCLNLLLRKQWVEREHLSYPVIQLPLEMTRPDGRFFHSRWMWLGFGVGAAIDIVNGLNFLFPAVPSLGGKLYDLQRVFTERPWNAIGWSPMGVFPFAVGMSFLIPLDLAFSAWAFWLIWRAERIAFAMIGQSGMLRGGTISYESEQSHGAYLGLAVLALWMTRKHLMYVARRVLKPSSDDDAEPISYRGVAIGLAASSGFIVLFAARMGMSFWVIGLYFTIWFAIAVAITRLRAELGSPVHDLHFIGPDDTLPKVFGVRRLGTANLTAFSYLYFLNRAHRSHAMPHQLEGLKLASEARTQPRRLVFLMVGASALGALGAFWAFLSLAYQDGGPSWRGRESFGRLTGWLTYARGIDPSAIAFLGVGVTVTLALAFLRMRFLWWNLHPVGYAVSGSWAINPLIGSIFVGWLCKWFVLRFGGMRAHRSAIPFFLGLILGEFMVGSFWSLLGISLNQPMYRFLF